MQKLPLLIAISIHAPSRERHGRGNGFSKSFTISIHAPSRERHLKGLTKLINSYNFNPRSLAGATNLQKSVKVSKGISIHAPSRERPYLSYRQLKQQ